MKKKLDLGRRGLIGAGLVGLGSIGGWLARKFQGPSQVRKPVPTSLDSRFVYDVSEFETTDPKLLLYNAGEHLPTGFDRAKRIEALPNGGYVVAGDLALKFFNAGGTMTSQFALPAAAHCLLVTGDDEIMVGFAKELAIYDFNGTEKWRSEKLPARSYLTSLAATEDKLYVCDGGNREVLIFNRKTGEMVDHFGKKDEEKNNPGFAVPSPYFDLTVASDGKLRIVNPGRLRMETYSLDGRFESSWGAPGLKVDRFCGCCNPVYFAMLPNGDYVTSEKGLARVNIYSPEGEFKGAVAGPETLVDDKELAKRACSDCSVGAGFDVACEESGRVLVLDPFRMVVRPFTP
ncbi:MAG: hypothetical protein KDL87_03940, partial [Verrucomicrobiae bacterium]|nr:hypothetical protein [Verrucomicrobiae bacterium]